MNAADRLVYSSSGSLLQLHWLKTKERIGFTLTVVVYKCMHGTAPPYLTVELSRSVDMQARCKLRSASSSSLVCVELAYQPPAIGYSGGRVTHMERSASLCHNCTFYHGICSRLKNHLFSVSFPLSLFKCTVSERGLCHFGHLNRYL